MENLHNFHNQRLELKKKFKEKSGESYRENINN